MATKNKKNIKLSLAAKRNFYSGMGVIVLALIIWPFLWKLVGNNLLDFSTFGCRSSVVTSQPLNMEIATAPLIEGTFTVPEDQTNFDALTFLAAPNGNSFAYVLKEINTERVALNGQPGSAYDKITFMMFSPDGRHFAYGAKQGGKEVVVLDGQPGKLYDWTLPPRFFTPDSRYFVYKTRIEAGDILVFNNGESRAYDTIYPLFISADGEELVYFGRVGRQFWRTSLALDKDNISVYESLGN